MINQKLKTRLEIADELNISYKTLTRILKDSELNIPSRKLLTPADYKLIYDLVKGKY